MTSAFASLFSRLLPQPLLQNTPSKRCDWIDQLRGWAVIVMIEVHVVNAMLINGLRPKWLDFVNGLVAPSFLMAAGFSLSLSTFKEDGSVKPFWPHTAKRLGFILLCAYALHAPGFCIADLTVLCTPQEYREFFKIDVLQCVVFSLLILHLLARLFPKPKAFMSVCLALALFIPLISPMLWAQGVADGFWLPIRGLFNGNVDRGVKALFPLFPWMAFPAFGAFLGSLYQGTRSRAAEGLNGQSRWSEGCFLGLMAIAGLLLMLWGNHQLKPWLWNGEWLEDEGVFFLHTRWGAFTWNELLAMSSVTLPSVACRLGWVLMIGSALGWLSSLRKKVGLLGQSVLAASHESLLAYVFHLILIFGFVLKAPIADWTGWSFNTFGWTGSILMSLAMIGLTLAVAMAWQRIRKDAPLMHRIQQNALRALAIWFFFGHWWIFTAAIKHPKHVGKPYPFLEKGYRSMAHDE